MKIAAMLLCILVIMGCAETAHFPENQVVETGITVTEPKTLVEPEKAEAKQADSDNLETKTASEEKEDSGKENSEEQDMEKQIIEKNTSFMMEQIGLTNIYAVTGTAQRLARCGCGTLTEALEIKKDRGALIVSLRDDKEHFFLITTDEEGYLGTIRNEKGEYLFAPVD